MYYCYGQRNCDQLINTVCWSVTFGLTPQDCKVYFHRPGRNALLTVMFAFCQWLQIVFLKSLLIQPQGALSCPRNMDTNVVSTRGVGSSEPLQLRGLTGTNTSCSWLLLTSFSAVKGSKLVSAPLRL